MYGGAEAAFRMAIALRPGHALAYHNLGSALAAQKKYGEAEAALRKAIALRPDHALAHFNLGLALHAQKKHREAEAVLRKAIALRPEDASAHTNLGAALQAQKKHREAEAVLRKVVVLRPNDAGAYNNLGLALHDQKRYGEAEAAYRKALALRPDYASAHCHLGSALADQKKYGEAEAACRKAIALRQDFPEAHYNLGVALREQKKLGEAVTAFRRADQLLVNHPAVRTNLRRAERMLALDRKLTAFLEGKGDPATPRERLELAAHCGSYRERPRTALRLCEEAFKGEPKLADDLTAQHRYRAACFSALAAAGKGQDGAKLPEAQRAELRAKALAWLQADLKAYQGLLKDKEDQRPLLRQRMEHWLNDKDFAAVRSPTALAKLPEAERKRWQQLWTDVAALLKRAGGAR
jgi:Flp pilus assembly protein TadD